MNVDGFNNYIFLMLKNARFIPVSGKLFFDLDCPNLKMDEMMETTEPDSTTINNAVVINLAS